MKYFVIISMLVVLSCKKTEDRSCFKAYGGLVTKELNLSDFEKVYMGPHLKYELVQDTVNKVLLIGGKNLLNFIETDVESGKLSVRNNNKCNFLRSYDKKVTAVIHFKKLINIEFEGTEKVTCRNQLQSDYFTLSIRDGAGEFNLNLNAISLNIDVSHGWGNFVASGNVNYLRVNAQSNGYGSTYQMNVSDSLHVISNSSELLKVNTSNCQFRGQTHQNGDIWYIGTPTVLEFNKYGDGDLFNKN